MPLPGTISAPAAPASLSAGVRPEALGRNIAFLGDSITDYTGASPSYFAFINVACQYAGYIRARVAVMAGVPGNTSAQMLARLQSDVLSNNPDCVHILAGTNDAGHQVPIGTYIANMTTIINTVRHAGIPIIVSCIPPVGSAYSNASQFMSFISSYNTWIKLFAPRLGAIVADARANITSSTGYMNANCVSADNLHPSSLGHHYIGEAIGAALQTIWPDFSIVTGVDASPYALVANPLMAGTIGSGNKPTGWYNQSAVSGSGTITPYIASVMYGAQQVGNDFYVDVNGTSGSVSVIYGYSVTPTISIGDLLGLTFRMQINDIAGGLEAGQVLSQQSSGTNQMSSGVHLNNAGLNVTNFNELGIMNNGVYFITWAATATTPAIWWNLSAASGVHYQAHLSELQVYNLTSMGLNNILV